MSEYVDEAVRLGRAAAEELMVDVCVITRDAAGEGTWDEADGRYTPDPPITLYGPDDGTGKAGRCKVQTFQAFESTPDVGERRITVQRYYLHLPVPTSPGHAVRYHSGDVAEILVARRNPALVGTRLIVAGGHDKSLQTAQRLLVDEVLPRG